LTPFPLEERDAKGESKRGEDSLKKCFPLSFEGKRDTGGEVGR